MDKENVVYSIHNGMLFSYQKEDLPFAMTWVGPSGHYDKCYAETIQNILFNLN